MPESSSALSATASPPRHSPGPLGQDNLLSIIESLLDPGILAISLWIVSVVVEGELLPPYLILSVMVFAITYPGSSHLQSSVGRLLTDICFNWLWVAGLFLLVAFATHYMREFSTLALITWLWVAPLSQVGAHLALRAIAPYLLMLQGPPQRAIIVGMNEQGLALAGRISETPYSRIELAGFFDDRDGERLGHKSDFSLRGKLSALSAFVKENGIQLIYLSLPMASQPRILRLLEELRDTTASIYFVPDIFMFDLIQARVDSVGGLPVVAVCESPFFGTTGVLKRLSDLVIATCALVRLMDWVVGKVAAPAAKLPPARLLSTK